MSYELAFAEPALKEWRKLGTTVRAQFKHKLAEWLNAPHVPASRLHNLPDCYKIKLRSSGYRLVYLVEDQELIVTVVAVGKREQNRVYRVAQRRLKGTP